MNRRNFLKAGSAGLLIPFAPAIVKAGSLMPVKTFPVVDTFEKRFYVVAVFKQLTGVPIMGDTFCEGREERLSQDSQSIYVSNQHELNELMIEYPDAKPSSIC